MLLERNVEITKELVRELIVSKIDDLDLFPNQTVKKKMYGLISDSVNIIIKEAKVCDDSNKRRWLMGRVYEACNYLIDEHQSVAENLINIDGGH